MPAATNLVASRYQLRHLVGRGGMSDVYRAFDTESGQEVAVKIVRASEPVTARRVAREAEAFEALDHPNLVRVLQAGTFGGDAYLVMEFVDGHTLADRCHQGRMSSHEVERVATGVAAALACVHAAGVVHRDVKPANILLGRDGRVRLGDFGIARLSGAETLTGAGSTVGTLAYMAPEQLYNHRVGAPADVWSLGVVLLECLSGHRWYEGPPAQIVASRLRHPISIPDDLPARWRSLLADMLRDGPTDRVSAAEVCDVLAAGRRSGAATWGAPARGPSGQAAGGGLDATVPLRPPDVSTATDLSPPGAVPGRRRRRVVVVAALALVATVLIPLLAWSDSSSTTSGPSSHTTSTTLPAGASEALAALASTVRDGEAAGSVTAPAGSGLEGLANQAVSEAGARRTDLASFDLQQAAAIVASGPAQHTIAGAATSALQHDLAVLASTLGLAGAATVPTVAPTTQPPAPAPRPSGGRHHHGGGDGGGQGGDEGG
jgi:serine/threonine protein kinase